MLGSGGGKLLHRESFREAIEPFTTFDGLSNYNEAILSRRWRRPGGPYLRKRSHLFTRWQRRMEYGGKMRSRFLVVFSVAPIGAAIPFLLLLRPPRECVPTANKKRTAPALGKTDESGKEERRRRQLPLSYV